MTETLPAEEVLRERLRAELDSMDQRTRAAKQSWALLEESVRFTRELRQQAAIEVREAAEATREAARRADAAEAKVQALEEAAKLRVSGTEEPGQAVRFQQPEHARRARDWSLAEIEETCFRLRVAGCVDSTRLQLNYNYIDTQIPTNSELIPSKAEMQQRRAHMLADQRRRRVRLAKRAALAVPTAMVAVPAVLLVVYLFKTAVSFLWELL